MGEAVRTLPRRQMRARHRNYTQVESLDLTLRAVDRQQSRHHRAGPEVVTPHPPPPPPPPVGAVSATSVTEGR